MYSLTLHLIFLYIKYIILKKMHCNMFQSKWKRVEKRLGSCGMLQEDLFGTKVPHFFKHRLQWIVV